MNGFIKVFAVGNLTKTPEIRYTSSGKAVTDLSIAVNEKSKAETKTTYIDVTVFEDSAKNCCEYLAKGRPVMVEGKLRIDSWQDKNGNKKSKPVIVAQSVTFLGGGNEITAKVEAPEFAETKEDQEEIPF